MIPSGAQPLFSYFKRFKMEVDLAAPPASPVLPDGFRLIPWDWLLTDLHADVLFESFHDEIDSTVFPSLGSRSGCLMLMNEITRKPSFVPGATWLLEGADGPCGSVQGLRDASGMGAIQNLGVVPAYRGQGLGTALLLRALHGFREAGLRRAFLEVTACNEAAVRLYRRLGFLRRKTLYKTVPNPFSSL